ncbi:hypothetical protein ADK67_46390 [Saccharothrix sp. NRRL B-16348]|nr:hypothetical protein ADK67_46390 [Saccharothrix sp. NRRL B-16348]
MLLFYARKPVSTDLIGRTLWRDVASPDLPTKLQPQLSKLRKILKDAGFDGAIHRDGNAYRIDVDPRLVDYHRFRKLAEKGRAAAAQDDHRLAKALLGEALELWRGEPLQDLAGPWADHIRDQLELFDRLIAQQALLDSRLQLGEYAEVVGTALRLTEAHDTDETCARLYLQSLYGLGKYSHALEFHERFSDHLMDSNGVEPGPELRVVYRAILRKQAHTGDAEPDPRKSPRRHLFRALKSFAGRADLLDRLDAILDGSDGGQVVALHGMPGVGKTRLATEWAHRRVDRFPDGAFALDLQGIGPGAPLAADDAAGILLTKLGEGPVPASGAERRARLQHAVDGRRLLVLLDNAGDSGHVRPILDAMPSCFVLITSRTRPFGLPVHDDAHVILVPPLSPAEATAVLRAVIGSSRAAEDPRAVRELVRRSAGLPLALRIIAQHVDHRPETALADLVEEFRRDEGLGVLGSSEDSDDEHGSLLAAFSWSYRSLPVETARVFRLLGLHPTTEFSAEATSALLGEPETTADRHLRTLTKVNLLQHGTAHRFRLHDLLHEHAYDLVQREESAAQRARARTGLLNHYLGATIAACRRLNPDRSPVPALDDVPVTERFDHDRDALDWFVRERANLVAAVLDAGRHGFPEHTWRLSANLHEVFDRLGYHEDLLRSQHAAVEAVRTLRDRAALGGTLSNTATVHFRLRQYDTAIRLSEEALAVIREVGQPELEAITVHNLGNMHLERGDIGRATALFDEALALARDLGLASLEAATLEQLGFARHRVEREVEAFAHYEAALAVWNAVNSRHGRATVLVKMQACLHAQGKHAQALELFDAAFEANQDSGDRPRMVEALATAAEAHLALNDFDAVIAAAERAEELPAAGASRELARALHAAGHAHVAIGDHEGAHRRWTRAAELCDAGSTEAVTVLDHLRDLRALKGAIPDPRAHDERFRTTCRMTTRDGTR